MCLPGRQRTCRTKTLTTTTTTTRKNRASTARRRRLDANSDATGRRSASTSSSTSNERSNEHTTRTSTRAKTSLDVPASPRPGYRSVIRVGGLTLQVTLPPKVPAGESSDISRTLPAREVSCLFSSNKHQYQPSRTQQPAAVAEQLPI